MNAAAPNVPLAPRSPAARTAIHRRCPVSVPLIASRARRGFSSGEPADIQEERKMIRLRTGALGLALLTLPLGHAVSQQTQPHAEPPQMPGEQLPDDAMERTQPPGEAPGRQPDAGTPPEPPPGQTERAPAPPAGAEQPPTGQQTQPAQPAQPAPGDVGEPAQPADPAQPPAAAQQPPAAEEQGLPDLAPDESQLAPRRQESTGVGEGRGRQPMPGEQLRGEQAGPRAMPNQPQDEQQQQQPPAGQQGQQPLPGQSPGRVPGGGGTPGEAGRQAPPGY